MSVTTYTHMRLSNVDKNGNVDVMYPQNTAEDVLIKNKNMKLPEDINSLDDAIQHLTPIAFTEKINESNLDDDLTKIISEFKKTNLNGFKITSFDNDNSAVEKGSSITSAIFSWEIDGTPVSLSLNDEVIQDPSIDTKKLTFTKPITTDTEFTLSATDEWDNVITAKCYIKFLNGIYYGAGATNIDNGESMNNFIHGLTQDISDKVSRTIELFAGSNQHAYYVIPAKYNTPSFSVNGFTGGFELYKTVDYKNTNGVTESYNLFRTVNTNLGNLKIKIEA